MPGMQRRKSSHAVWTAGCLTVWLAVGAMALAQAERGEDDAGPDIGTALKYLRVEVPVAQPEKWPTFGYQFDRLPRPLGEFEQLLQEAGDTAGVQATQSVRSDTCHLSASLEGDVLVGEGVLEVNASNGTGGLLSLAGCQLAISNARWNDGSEAIVGTAAEGQPLAIVPASGKLNFSWSLRGQRSSSGALRFDLKLPPSANGSVDLSYPAEMKVIAGNGIVRRSGQAEGPQHSVRLELGGARTARLIILPNEAAEVPSGSALVRQTNNFRISKRGLVLTSRMDLNVVARPLSRPSIDVQIDPGLRPISVEVDDQPATWRIGESGESLTVDLDEPLPVGKEGVLTITGVAPLPQTEDQRLPSFRSADLIWESTTDRVRVEPNLAVGQLEVTRGTLIQTRGSPEAKAGTEVEIQYYSKEGFTQLVVVRKKPRASVDYEYAWNITDGKVVGFLRATITSAAGDLQELAFDLAPSWRLSEVDARVFSASPDGEGVVERAFALSGGAPNSEGGNTAFQLVLEEPLRPTEQIFVELPASYALPLATDSTPLRRLVFAEFVELHPGRRVAALATSMPAIVKLEGEGNLRPIPETHLSAATRAWLAEGPALAVESEADLRDASLVLQPTTPSVRANISHRIAIGPEGLHDRYHVEVTPETAGVERLTVSLWPPRDETLTWAVLGDSDQSSFRAERISATDSGATETNSEVPEVWEIRFAKRKTKRFHITAQRNSNSTTTAARRASLMSVAQSTSQQGRVVVVSQRGTAIEVEREGMRAVAPSAGDLDVAPEEELRAVLGYAPTSAIAPIGASLKTRSLENSPWYAFASRMTLVSSPGTGQTFHSARWEVENFGRGELQISVPPGGDPGSLTVDGEERLHGQTGPDLNVDVSDAGRNFTVELQFTTPRDGPGIWNSLAASVPQIDVSVLQRRWFVNPPAGYRMRAKDSGKSMPAIHTRLHQMLTAWRGRAEGGCTDEEVDDAVVALVDDLDQRVRQPRATWGNVLLESQLFSIAASSQSGPRLLLDEHALAAAGIDPKTEVAASPSSDDAIGELLRDNGLALVAAGDRVLLVGNDFVDGHRENLVETNLESVYKMPIKPAIHRFDEPEYIAANYVTAQTWNTAAVYRSRGNSDGQVLTATPAHQAMGVEIPFANAGTSIFIYHVKTFAACALALALALAAAVIWLGRPALRWQFAACLTLVGLVFVVPEPWDLLAAGALAGTVVGTGVLLAASRRTEVAIRPAFGILAIAFASAFASLKIGETPTCSWDEDPAPVYPVWFPVNQEGESTGYVHLPRPFAEALKTRAEANAPPEQSWLIDRAEYDLALAWERVDEDLQVESLTMRFDIRVLDDSRVIELPLSRGELALLDDWALLDDEMIDPTWLIRQHSIEIPVAGRGQYHLQLRVRPAAVRSLYTAEVSIAVPATLETHLRATAPAGAPDVQIVNCFGAMSRQSSDDSDTTVYDAALGPVESLNVSWPRQREAAKTEAKYTTDELLWLDLAANPPRLEVLFLGEIESGQPQHVTVAVDSSLKNLTADAKVVPPNDRHLNTYVLPIEVTGEKFTALATFELPNRSPVGNFTLPPIDCVGVSRRRRWVAVSPPANLSLSAATSLSAAKWKDFPGEWEFDADQPTALFAFDRKAEVHQFALTHQLQPATIEEEIVATVSRRETLVRYEASISPRLDPPHFYSIIVPDHAIINSVNVQRSEPQPQPPEEDDRSSDHVAWWAVHGNRLQVYLKAPLADAHQLIVEGQAPHKGAGRLRVPLVQFQGAQIVSSQLQLQRNFGVLVDVVRTVGYEIAEPSKIAADTGVRAVRSFSAIHDKQPTKNRVVVFQVRDNASLVAAEQLTQLIQKKSTWQAVVELRLSVLEGELDHVDLLVPNELADSLTVDQHPWSTFETLNPEQRRLRIWPADAVTESIHLRVTAENVVRPGDEVAPPAIALVGAASLQHFVTLPSAIDGRQVAWETEGMRRHAGEQAVPEFFALQPDSNLYEVISSPHGASLKTSTELAGIPIVRLADLAFARGTADEYFGLATFDLTPGGLDACTIELPSGAALAHVSIDGIPEISSPVSASRWRLKLRSNKLPQRIELFYSGEFEGGSTPIDFEAVAPVLSDIEVERTLWTVYAPTSYRPGPASDTDLPPQQQDVIRMRALTDSVRLPQHLRLAHSTAEIRDWLVMWNARWQSQRAESAQRELVRSSLGLQSRSTPWRELDANFQQAIEDLGLPAEDFTNAPPNPTNHRDWNEIVSEKAVVARRLVKGSSQRTPVQLIQLDRQRSSVSWLIPVCFFLTAVGAATSKRWFPPIDVPARFGHAIALAIAMVVAVAVWPPILFLGIALAGWAAFDRNRRGPAV